MSLREMFLSKIQGKLYAFLKVGVLKEWETSTVYKFAISTIEECDSAINEYLQKNSVTLLNMDQHADNILRTILIPYLNQKRVE